MIEPGALTTCYATHITVTYTCAACEKQKVSSFAMPAGEPTDIPAHVVGSSGWTSVHGKWFCGDHVVSAELLVDGRLFTKEN